MNLIYTEYMNILIFLTISIILSIIVFSLSYILAYQNINTEKASAYECGFDPFEDARNKFDVWFYLVAILFIIFDLEIAFLFPWSICLNKVSFFGFWTMFIFLVILTIGFLYEWWKGALEWQ